MTIDFIPVKYYSLIFLNVLFVIVALVFFHSKSFALGSSANLSFLKKLGLLFFVFVLLYIGLRPIDGIFIDMTNYAYMFGRAQDGNPVEMSQDPVFNSFILFCAKVTTVEIFFLLCTVLYVLPLLLVSKKWFKEYWFYGFLMFVVSFSFYSYGTNGIRNGIAGSLFLMGMSREKMIPKVLWILLAVNFHSSIMLPAIAYALSFIYNKPKGYIIFWFVSIPLSIVGGNFWEGFFANLGFDDQRLNYLTTEADATVFAATGFRWDFLLYGATAVFSGWYFIFKKGFEDKIYFRIYNTYVLANAVWILVIRANFSNRFAYLSWFMMGAVIIYPLLVRKDLILAQHKKVGAFILFNFLFTYLMGVIIG